MLHKFVNVYVAVCLMLAVVLVGTVRAQTSRGTIVGHITDPSGATVPGARVTATNLGTNISFHYSTDNTGDYYVPGLLPGLYRVEAEKAGFKKEVVSSVTLEVNQTLRVDFTLQLGQTTQTVEVTAAAPMLQTDTTTVGQVVGNRQLVDLPIMGRDFSNLLKLSVAVTELGGTIGASATIRMHGYNDNWRAYSVDGARPTSVSFMVDGVSVNDAQFQAVTNVPPPDAIEEFKLQNGGYSADFGMGAAQVNVALKSGANALHGSLWDFMRNDALQPKNQLSHTKTPLRLNQFGFTVGGPVELPHVYKGRDRTFFFGSYQGGRRLQAGVSQTQVPTDQEKNNDNFSDWTIRSGSQAGQMLQLYNPLTAVPNPAYNSQQPLSPTNTPVLKTPFPGNQIPSSMIAQTSSNLLKYWPEPNLNCSPMPCNNYQGSVTSSNSMDQYMVRIDHNIGDSDRLFGDWLWQRQVAYSPSLIPLSGTKETQKGGLFVLHYAHSFGSRTLNEARVGYNRLWFLSAIETAFGPTNYWAQAGLVNLDTNSAYNALPAVSPSSSYSGIGYGGTSPINEINNIYQFNDVLTMTRGRHSMKVGADIRRNQIFNETGSGGNGLLNFNGAYTAQNPIMGQTAGAAGTGNGFADFLLGYLSSASFRAFDQTFARIRNSDWMFYYQDDFRVTPRLTLNLGMRWELHTPWHDQSNGGSVFDFTAPGGRVVYADKNFSQLGNNPILFGCCVPSSLINTDMRDWAPRVGIAWRPLAGNERFVVRASYGIFYDVMDNYYPMQSVSSNLPYLSPTLPSPSFTESTPPINIRNMFPAPYTIASRSFPAPYCQAPSSNVINSQGILTSVVNYCPGEQTQLPDNKTPYLQQWGANLQYQLTPTVMVELGYQGSHGLREPIQWIFNQATPPPTTGNANNTVRFDSQCPAGTLNVSCFPTQDRVPYKNFGQTGFANANILQSKYNALTFKVDKRFAHGFTTLATFTWGHAFDQFSEIQAQSGTISSIAPDAHNLNSLWGSAAFDITRRVVWSGVWELPVGLNKRFLNHRGVVNQVLGGWQINQITTLSDGPPFDIGCGCGDQEQTGNTYNVQKPNLVGNPLPSNRSVYNWFNPAAFAVPTLGTAGNTGRNILRTTHQTAVDFSVMKTNHITERVNLQFRAEFFNFFSSETYFPLYPSGTKTSANFGMIIDAALNQTHANLFNPRIIQLALKLNF